MPVRTIKIIKPFVWIPPDRLPSWLLTVTRADGTVDDVTDELINLTIEDMATTGIGTFEFEVPNLGRYTNVWTGMEIVRFYCDYADTATTLRFRGRIEKPTKKENNMRVSGRSESLFIMDKTVTQSYNGWDTSDILIDLFTKYGDGRFTTTGVTAVSGTTLTVNWVQKPFWDCVQDLCTAANYDCYINCNLVVNYFAIDSVNNTTDVILHDHNLFETSDFTPDSSQIKNKIIIYGAKNKDIQVIYTAEDTDSQTEFGVRDLIINDENITNETQAQEYGDYLLAQKKTAPLVGEMRAVLLATIQPGERLRISDDDNGLAPNSYRINNYKHEIDEGGIYTTVKIEKEPRRLSHFLKERIENESKKQDVSLNPYELKYSFNQLFDNDSGTHDKTEITGGVLRLQSGESSGSWESDTRTTKTNITKIYVAANGETLTGITVDISGDDGTNWESITLTELKTISLGSYLKVRINISNADTQIKNLGVLYT